MLREHNFPPDHIWNVDETGFVHDGDPSKTLVCGPKGVKQVSLRVQNEKTGDSHITVIGAINAAGHVHPPGVIFKGASINEGMMIDQVFPGSVVGASNKGWVTKELFRSFMRHFATSIGASTDNKHLVVMDGHSTHLGSAFQTEMQDLGIVLVWLPSLTTPYYNLSTSQPSVM